MIVSLESEIRPDRASFLPKNEQLRFKTSISEQAVTIGVDLMAEILKITQEMYIPEASNLDRLVVPSNKHRECTTQAWIP